MQCICKNCYESYEGTKETIYCPNCSIEPLHEILDKFGKEYLRARNELGFDPMHSTHEGYGIIKEELEELEDEFENYKSIFEELEKMDKHLAQLIPFHRYANPIELEGWLKNLNKHFDKLWSMVKDKQASFDNMKAEAIQVGAMALAFSLEIQEKK